MIRVDTIKNRNSFAELTVSLVDKLLEVMRKERSDIAGNLPFRNGWVAECHHGENYMIIRLEDAPGIESPMINEMESTKLQKLKENIENIGNTDFDSLYQNLGAMWYSHDIFTYIGESNLDSFEKRWNSIKPILWNWADKILVPTLYELERKKLNIILPKPIEIDISKIADSLWILECEDTSKQGTAFTLDEMHIITCEHVLGDNTKAFKADNHTKTYDIEILKRHKVIDLAIIKVKDYDCKTTLTKGTTENLKQMDRLVVAGFPNYRFGDTGSITSGNLAGFRMVSGIRRILVSMPLIAGNSGGPVLNSDLQVIGVAATGADRMENAPNTEHHGVIPIEALDLIK